MASRTQNLLDRRSAVVPIGVGQFAGPRSVAAASGAMMTDLDGGEFIDFAGGIGVQNVGHCHEKVVAAIRDQAAKLIHACIHVATYEPYIALCEKLAALLPHGPATKVMLVNSGAEAVENAIKIARQATGRPAVICFSESFHGRTLLCASLTSKTAYKSGCGPFMPEVYRLPYPNHFRYGDGLTLDAFVDRELNRLRQAFVNTVRSEDVAAIILEIVQGEGGFCVAPAAYLRGLRKLCDEFGIMLIFDEVQSGFCRTGAWAAYEHFDVLPDISTWAKSLGAGMPISSVIGRADIMDKARPGTLGGTYGGNPVACAAALAAIEVMEELDLNRRAREIGKRVHERFRHMQSCCPMVADVRGLGAMVAMEFQDAPESDIAAAAAVQKIILACGERGLLVIPAGTYGTIIRVLSPLVISDEQLERGLKILEEETFRHTGARQSAHAERSGAAVH